MEAGDRAAGDGDEAEGEERSGNDRPAAVRRTRVSAGICRPGLTMTMPSTSSAIVPIFMNELR